MSEKNSAAGMPAVERVHTVDDVKTALEASATAIHEAIHIAREVWEKDADALHFALNTSIICFDYVTCRHSELQSRHSVY